MISDYIDKSVPEKKSGPMFYAMSFYNDLRKQHYDKNAIFVLKENIDWLSDGTNEDDELCLSSIMAYIELCMAELIHEGMKEIKEANHLYKAVTVRDSIKDFKGEEIMKKSWHKWNLHNALWNYEDEVLALQASIKFTMANIMQRVADIELENGKVELSDINQMYDEMLVLLEDQGLPTVNKDIDDDEEKETSLDLITASLVADNYIKNVVDFCFSDN